MEASQDHHLGQVRSKIPVEGDRQSDRPIGRYPGVRSGVRHRVAKGGSLRDIEAYEVSQSLADSIRIIS
jgi:hypothetical protein